MDSSHELESVLDETFQAKDVNADTPSDLPFDGEESNEGGTSCKCLQKCATFPIAVAAEKTVHVVQPENDTHHLCSLSLSTAPKLVSALKGSREKEGLPLKKLSVSWASDVYDPPPTSVSHYLKKKIQQKIRSNKKHGKGKQKTKNKKHYHKIGSKSNKCVDTLSNTDTLMPASDCRSSSKLLDFKFDEHDEIVCPVSNCSSSYLGKRGSTLHFAYAEAT